jgi:hypothetical protein
LSACLDYSYDICPNCGSEAELVESSGWCDSCTKEFTTANNLCIDCGAEVDPNHQRKLCWNCKEERWLKKYGDVIEYLMLGGLSFNKAREMVADAVRPVCVVCGGPIKGGTPGESLFCSTTIRCKQVRNKYRRLINSGVSNDFALEQAMG